MASFKHKFLLGVGDAFYGVDRKGVIHGPMECIEIVLKSKRDGPEPTNKNAAVYVNAHYTGDTASGNAHFDEDEIATSLEAAAALGVVRKAAWQERLRRFQANPQA